MNVLEMLDKELQERQAYSLESKRRYLYLRLCQLFSFDSRYHNCIYELLKDKAEPLKEELRNKIINLEDVTDFKITCKPFSKYVITIAFRELLNTDVEVKYGEHCWIEFEENQTIKKADATIGDFSRAKIRFSTKGYRPIKKDKSYKEKLKNIDQNLGYIDIDYDNDFWIHLIERDFHDFMQETDWINHYNSMQEKNLLDNIIQNLHTVASSDDLIVEKYEKVKSIFNYYRYLASKTENYFPLIEHEDIKAIVEYFLIKMNVNFLSTVYLFQDYDDKDWDFIDIYPVHLKDNSLYYAIRKEKNTYIFDKVDNEEANIYLKELKGKNKELFYRRQ